MTMEKYLTVRWNNWLTLGLGIPAVIYVAAVLVTAAWAGRDALIGLAVIGALY